MDKAVRLGVTELTGCERFREPLARLATHLGRPEGDVAADATACLEEMVATHGDMATGVWKRFGRLMLRAYTVDVDGARLNDLRALSRRHPLVFLPSHRSYLDPVVMRSALQASGLPRTHVLGGINAAFWPIGPMARRSGHIFIRRTTRDNPVYKLALRQYIAHLVGTGQHLEWYIEGGRTRTGKLRPPRFGLLAYLMEAFAQGAAEDVMLVPVSIVYEVLPEVAAMAAEDQGAARRGDNLGWLVGYARAQGRTRSTVHVRFGEPLSLRDSVHNPPAPLERPVDKVAVAGCPRFNRAAPTTTT